MQTADIPLRKVAAVAVVKNPLVGCYQDDLSELVAASPSIGELVAWLALAALAPFQPESYGKAAVVGLRGEQEHGVALLTTPFGNILREAAGGGLAWISSQSKGSEERRVGKECVSKCRTRRSPDHYKTTTKKTYN